MSNVGAGSGQPSPRSGGAALPPTVGPPSGGASLPPPAPAAPGGNRVKPVAIVAIVAGVLSVLGGAALIASAIGGDHEPAPPDPATVVTVPVTTPTPTPTIPSVPVPEPPTVPESPSVIRVGQGISVTPADGWTKVDQRENAVLLGTRGATLDVVVGGFDQQMTAENLAGEWQRQQSAWMSEFKPTTPTPVDLEKPSITSAVVYVYTGTLTNQQTSTPVEGSVVTFVTQNGVGVIMDATYGPGKFESFKEDLGAMWGSVIAAA